MLTVKTHYPSYHSSADKVLKLPQVQRWLNSVRSLGKRTTTGVETDRTEFIQHKCFWSVSLFEKEDEQLHRWRDYLVEINGQEILEFQADESLVKVQ